MIDEFFCSVFVKFVSGFVNNNVIFFDCFFKVWIMFLKVFLLFIFEVICLIGLFKIGNVFIKKVCICYFLGNGFFFCLYDGVIWIFLFEKWLIIFIDVFKDGFK